MKKINIFITFFVMLSCLCYGNPVDPSAARQIAEHFWAVVSGDSEHVKWTDISTEAGFHEFYIFTRDNSDGFVLVAADNRVQPILGYSTDSRFVTPLPAHVFSFLQRYEQEITYCREHSISATNEIEQQWNSLIEGTYTPQLTTAVAPLLSTTWAQSPYYNSLCPDSSGVHAVTGCVATATAQVMKFWNWPATGYSSHNYTDDNFGYQSANFGNTTYNWNQMPNELGASSSATQVNAVATLMYHIGVAVEMDYGIEGSSAMLNSYGYSGYACAENALKNYFRYKNTLHSVYKDEVTETNWISTLTNELNAGRPLLERGGGDAGGHAFVCDGYDNNGLFHINWGWGNYQNGYFAHNALNPGNYTFNEGTAVIVGIEPNGALFVSTPTLTFSQEGGSQTFTVTPNSTGNTPWSASSNASWLTLTPSSGNASTTSTVTATATANNTGTMRSAVITVTQGSQSVTIQVTQNECSSNDMCTITLQMTDSYGDGWNGAYLTLTSASGSAYGTATCDGSSSSQTFSVCSTNLILTWSSGQWDSECAFSVISSNGITLLTVNDTPSGNYTVSDPCNSSVTPTDSCTITQFPWTESFEDDVSCWSVIDGDGDGNNWFWATGAPYDGTHSMASYSYNSNLGGALFADNLLVTPAISLPATGSYDLVFHVRCGNSSYPDDIAVKLTTGAGTNFSDFNITLMPLTSITTTTYQQYSVSLAAYQGQTVRIAFVHNTYDGLYLSLDAVSITNASSSGYQITTLSANSAIGAASGGGTFNLGDSISISATAQPGYRFTGWDDGNTENPRVIVVSGNATYTAYFDNLGTDEHHYDNGEVVGNIGAGGSLYWGIRFPAGELSGYNTLSAVKIMDLYPGTYELRVYQGGANAPGTLVYNQNYALNGTEDWYTATLTAPVTIDHAQPLWVVFYNTGVNYPAIGSNYAGNPEGSWVSVDGQSWASVCDYGFYYTWMIRAILSNSGSPTDPCTITSFPWIESFENGASCWTTIDGDGDGNNWGIASGNGYSGTHFATSQFNYNSSNPNYCYNFLISPSITLPTNGTPILSFHAHSGSAESPGTLSVFLTTGEGTSPSDFNVDIMSFVPITTTNYQQYIVNLSAYNGQTIKLAFLHAETNSVSNSISIDNVSIITNPSSYSITVNSSNSSMGNASGGGTYTLGDSISLSATAQLGYRFTGWNDGNTENPRIIVVSGNATYTANFDNLGTDEHHYDNGTYVGSIGAGGTLYWGIRFPAGELSNYNTLEAVKIMDMFAGTYELRVYQGGSNAPGTLVYNQSFTLNGTENWYTATLSTPLSINNSQTLWITFYNTGTNSPAAGSHYAGNHNGSWVSTNGQSWTTINNYGYYYTWMIRAMLSNSTPQQYTITVNSAQPEMGTTTGGGTFDYGSNIPIRADAYNGYKFVRWNDGNTDNPRTVTVTGEATYTAHFQPTVGIEDITNPITSIYSYANYIVVENAEGVSVEIYDMTGKLIVNEACNNSKRCVFTVNSSGVYVVRTGNGVTRKVTVMR